jgi:hypothetical protein
VLAASAEIWNRMSHEPPWARMRRSAMGRDYTGTSTIVMKNMI